MRKHSVRNFLHAVLDLLPLLVIPIFAINIINRSPEPISVEVGSSTPVANIEYQYKYQTNDVNTLNDLVEGNLYHLNSDFNYISSTTDIYFKIINGTCTLTLDSVSLSDNNDFVISNNTLFELYYDDGDFYLFYCNDFEDLVIELNFYNLVINADIVLTNIVDFDLNLIDDFSISSYNEIESATATIVYEGDTVVYDDTDIGSQFMYSLYKTTNDYFNFGDVFNLGQVYDWFNVNMFNYEGQLITSIVWHIIVYEFLMDILFLVYGLFMFIIDFGECLMDKPFNIKRGR